MKPISRLIAIAGIPATVFVLLGFYTGVFGTVFVFFPEATQTDFRFNVNGELERYDIWSGFSLEDNSNIPEVKVEVVVGQPAPSTTPTYSQSDDIPFAKIGDNVLLRKTPGEYLPLSIEVTPPFIMITTGRQTVRFDRNGTVETVSQYHWVTLRVPAVIENPQGLATKVTFDGKIITVKWEEGYLIWIE